MDVLQLWSAVLFVSRHIMLDGELLSDTSKYIFKSNINTISIRKTLYIYIYIYIYTYIYRVFQKELYNFEICIFIYILYI